jgi:hypothetical protein
MIQFRCSVDSFFWQGFMTEMPDVQAILKQFPWAIVNKDGEFNYELALALRSLLGEEGLEFGWWLVPLPDVSKLKKIGLDALFLDTHGSAPLSEKHFGEKDGAFHLLSNMSYGISSAGSFHPDSSRVRAQLDKLLPLAGLTVEIACCLTSSLAA